MFYINLGLRNLIKYRRRSLLTLFTIALGLACLLISKGYINYCLWGLRESIINGGVGHYQVFVQGSKDKADDDSFKYLMTDYKKLLRQFSVIPGIKFIAPRLSFTGLLSSQDRNTPVVGYGGWIEEEKGLMSFSTMEKGNFLRTNEPYTMLVGGGVASIINLDVDDSVTLSVALENGSINAMDFEVAGIIRNQLEEMENVFSCISLESAQQLLDEPESIDTLIIMLLDTNSMSAIEPDIRKICKANGLEFRTWDQIVPYYTGANEFYSSSMNIALVVILAIVLFSIANTMLMVVFERMRELGTIRSFGTRSSQIFRMMGCESVLLGFFGCVVGVGIALLSAYIINSLGGIPLPPPPGNSKSYQGLIFIEHIDVVVYSLVIISVSIISSFLPSLKAIRISIADSLRWI